MTDKSMVHIVKFEKGYDCIKFECISNSDRCSPSSGGSHGKHGLQIRFISKGPDGAVQFLLFTGCIPQHSEKSSIGSINIMDWSSHLMPAELGYHSKTARYEGQTSMGDCELLDGSSCYYDGSGLNASDAMYALVNGGDEALWKFLDGYYRHVFDGKEYPKPTEYKKPLRHQKKRPRAVKP